MQTDSKNSSTINISLAEYEGLKRENTDMKADLAYLRFQMEKLQKMLFASKGERFISTTPDAAQMLLKLDIETIPAPEITTEEVTYTRNKIAPKEKPCRKTASKPPSRIKRFPHTPMRRKPISTKKRKC